MDANVSILRKLEHAGAFSTGVEANALAGFWIPHEERIYGDVAIRRIEEDQPGRAAAINGIPGFATEFDQGIRLQSQSTRQFTHGRFIKTSLLCLGESGQIHASFAGQLFR